MDMKRNLLIALLMIVAGLQTLWGQGFRVYKSDGTIAEYSLRTDSIVFYEVIGTEQDFDLFTPVNQCIAGTWYLTKTETVTFNEDGTTDDIEGGTYEFMPYQGTVIIYNAAGAPVNYFKVLKVTDEKMIIGKPDGSNLSVWYSTTPIYYVTSIVLSETSIILLPDETLRLTATVEPSDADNPAVTWESSDESVAQVINNGLVVAMAEGTCIITCRATDGSGTYAECQVSVIHSRPVTEITLNQTSVSMEVDATENLTATVLPANATNKEVAWESSDETIATVSDEGLVRAVGGGNCTITCSATDGSGVKAECQVVVDEHEYVDLGLPSGTLWATCNVGANSPGQYGDRFAWGETQPKETYDWSTYKWCNGSSNTLTKYCESSKYGYNGFTDALTELLPEDDAATANWSELWQMPSKIQFDELINSSYTTIQYDAHCYKITSNSNGNSILLPAVYSPEGGISAADYWSRSVTLSYVYDAYTIRLYYDEFNIIDDWLEINLGYEKRCEDSYVRPVRKK